MSEDVFWRIIALFNWKRAGDDEAVIEPAVKALAQMSIHNIEFFEEILSEKLFALDTMEHASHIGEEAYNPGKYFSADWFLYVRCCVVANGREFYYTALSKPTNMPKDMEFESILMLAGAAFERKTNSEFCYSAKTSYETYSNHAGWQDAQKS